MQNPSKDYVQFGPNEIIQDTQYINATKEELTVIIHKNTQVNLVVQALPEHENLTLNLVLEDNAISNYMLLVPGKKLMNITQTMNLMRDAQLKATAALLGSQLTVDFNTFLQGTQADVDVKVMAISSENDSQKINVGVTHMAPHSKGEMLTIGIANKNGRTIVNGLSKIEKGMKQSNAFQTLRGIITDPKAVVEMNPYLLIDEHDVKAGHGATIGKISDEGLYYLMSRGLNKSEAERLIINGYLKPFVDAISDNTIRQTIEALIEEKL